MADTAAVAAPGQEDTDREREEGNACAAKGQQRACKKHATRSGRVREESRLAHTHTQSLTLRHRDAHKHRSMQSERRRDDERVHVWCVGKRNGKREGKALSHSVCRANRATDGAEREREMN